jgi:hypothetical protein
MNVLVGGTVKGVHIEGGTVDAVLYDAIDQVATILQEHHAKIENRVKELEADVRRLEQQVRNLR